jgi:hypothetical protein
MQGRFAGGKLIAFSFLFLIVTVLLFSCKKNDSKAPEPEEPVSKDDINNSIALKWSGITLNTIKFARFKSPTYSSRSLAYVGITMYESVVNADPAHKSLLGQLNGLNYLPIADPNSTYEWQLVLNSGVRTILKLLYPVNKNLSTQLDAVIDSAYQAHFEQYASSVDDAIIDRSVQFGKQLAEAIFEWSKTDGGYEGFLYHFDTTFAIPGGASYWIPPTRGQTVSRYPLHPHWGDNRTFIAENATKPTPAIVPYSIDKSSEYYLMYKEIYDMSKQITRTDQEIAAWWADDPTETYSPPGHSFNLGSIAIRQSNPGLVKAAETYARIGMATADAFICCWKTKSSYFNERPSTYIRTVIDSTWTNFWPEPPFPAFPSGHSTQASATSSVLTSLYGEGYAFTDNTHEGAVRFPFSDPMMPRSYTSFRQSAEETGRSRLLGGIHTRQDNETGLAEGEKIGESVNKLKWMK